MKFDDRILKKLKQLEEKYKSSGQDLESYLEGLLHADYLKYWDYIHLDTLLNIQKPETDLNDEYVFIIYHQTTELYFKLILLACEEIAEQEELTAAFYLKQVKRINLYYEMLIRSFDIMIEGMEKDQFRKFRMSLLPASGFQSAQYRYIEFSMTDLINLVDKDNAPSLNSSTSLDKIYPHLYWKKGATELATGEKTLTLTHFEEKYDASFKSFIRQYKEKNLWRRYLQLPAEEQTEELKEALRQLDFHANVNWPLVHYKAAVRYLYKKKKELTATGGTNWQEYLPARQQKIIFFPRLWSRKDKKEWGEDLKEAYTFLAEDRHTD